MLNLEQKGGFSQAPKNLIDAIETKVGVLAEGIAIEDSVGQFEETYKQGVQGLYGHYMGETKQFRVPQEIVLYKSEDDPKEAVVAMVRQNPLSRFRMTVDEDGNPSLVTEEKKLHIWFLPRPKYYDLKTRKGTEPWRISQQLGVDTAGVIPSNYCSYFSTKEECRFCEILGSYSQAREYPQSIKSAEEIQDAMNLALKAGDVDRLLLTTGNLDNENVKTVDLLVEAIKNVDLSQTESVSATFYPPTDLSHLQRLQDAGYNLVQMNMEVWNPNLFKVIVPGKNKYLGQKELIKAQDRAVEIFGPGNVSSAFPYGIQSLNESLDPSSHDPNKENDRCLEAAEFSLKRGVIPVFTLYHYTGSNRIGRITNMSEDHMIDFGIQHGRMVLESNILPMNRTGVWFEVGTVGNHWFNDFFYLTKKSQ